MGCNTSTLTVKDIVENTPDTLAKEIDEHPVLLTLSHHGDNALSICAMNNVALVPAVISHKHFKPNLITGKNVKNENFMHHLLRSDIDKDTLDGILGSLKQYKSSFSTAIHMRDKNDVAPLQMMIDKDVDASIIAGITLRAQVVKQGLQRCCRVGGANSLAWYKALIPTTVNFAAGNGFRDIIEEIKRVNDKEYINEALSMLKNDTIKNYGIGIIDYIQKNKLDKCYKFYKSFTLDQLGSIIFRILDDEPAIFTLLVKGDMSIDTAFLVGPNDDFLVSIMIKMGMRQRVMNLFDSLQLEMEIFKKYAYHQNKSGESIIHIMARYDPILLTPLTQSTIADMLLMQTGDEKTIIDIMVEMGNINDLMGTVTVDLITSWSRFMSLSIVPLRDRLVLMHQLCTDDGIKNCVIEGDDICTICLKNKPNIIHPCSHMVHCIRCTLLTKVVKCEQCGKEACPRKVDNGPELMDGMDAANQQIDSDYLYALQLSEL